MSAGTMMGFKLGAGSRTNERTSHRDPDYVARLEFIEACFALADFNSHLAVVGGKPSLETSDIKHALDDALPVLSSIAERLESQTDSLRSWNVQAAGRNEIILREIDRNWILLERLNSSRPDA